MIYLNLNKGIIATVSDDNITIHQNDTPYGVMQDVLGKVISKSINMIAVRLLNEGERDALKQRSLFSDGETAFIENVALAN